MTLAALRAQARAVATRMDARLSTALTAGRELTAEEQAAADADGAELAGIEAQVDDAVAGLDASVVALAGVTAIVVGAGVEAGALQAALVAAGLDGVTVTAAEPSDADAERARIVALVDLCPSSALSEPLAAAIADGSDAGAFAIALAKDAKTRGASLGDLRRGAVQAGQLPHGGKKPEPAKAGTLERGREIAARAASLGHSALAHLKSGG